MYALAAEGNGVINVNGDLLIENIGDSSSLTADVERYYNAVVAAGGSVNINVAGNAENKIRITGDLGKLYGNSAINLHLLKSGFLSAGCQLNRWRKYKYDIGRWSCLAGAGQGRMRRQCSRCIEK